MSKADEKDLWCAVIQQALADAAQPLPAPRLNARIQRARRDMIRARKWFTLPNPDFVEVCALAGMEPDRVRATARSMIEAAQQREPAMPTRTNTNNRTSQ